MKTFLPVLLAFSLAGCSQPGSPDAARPETAGQPMNPVRTAARLAAADVAAVAGDQAGYTRQAQGLQRDMMKSMKLADPARRIDPEAARAVVKTMPGVHSVAWIGRDNLLAIVDGNELRNQRTIDAICVRLEPLGDTLGVIVNLQTRAPRTDRERGTTSRNCQLAAGDVAMFQKVHPTYDPPPEVVAAFRASQRPGAGQEDAEEREARRILEANTPEM